MRVRIEWDSTTERIVRAAWRGYDDGEGGDAREKAMTTTVETMPAFAQMWCAIGAQGCAHGWRKRLMRKCRRARGAEKDFLLRIYWSSCLEQDYNIG